MLILRRVHWIKILRQRETIKYLYGREIEGEWDDMKILGNATIRYPNNDIYYGKVD